MYNSDDSIRKYGKKVNRNGWMFRLHVWTTGKEPRFRGYCPFFWTTWLYVLISPFMLVGNFFKFLAKVAKELVPEAPYETHTVKYPQEKPVVRPSDEQLVEAYEAFNDPYYKNSIETYGIAALSQRLPSNTIRWIAANSDWQKDYPSAKSRVEIIREAVRKAQLRREARRKRLEALTAKASNALSYLVKPVLALSLVFVGWVLWTAAKLAYSAVTLSAVLTVLTYTLTIAASVAAATLFVALIQRLFAWLGALYSAIPETPARIRVKKEKGPSWFKRLIEAVGSGIGFLFETVEMAYKKECPLIEYGEESGPITRRK